MILVTQHSPPRHEMTALTCTAFLRLFEVESLAPFFLRSKKRGAVIKDCMESSEVLTLLQPRPSSSSSRPAETPSSGEPPSKRFKGSGKGNKGKGSGKLGKDSFIRIPHELLALNAVPATPKGHRLCFSYNLKTCSNTVDKQRCPKGLHACAVKGCHKQHPALDCPGAGKE